MDLSFLMDYYITIVLVACLIVGYCIKHIEWLDKVSNEYIPTILTIFGAVMAALNAYTTGSPITVELIVSGAFTGLASTGLHQMFKQLLFKEE